MTLPMSRPAAGLLRSLLQRVGEDKDRILLTTIRSTDWHSLTFAGERHQLAFRLVGPDAAALLERFTVGLEDAEFDIPGQLVADIKASPAANGEPDGSLTIAIEALTISE